jgi:hypothetical protein
LSINYLIKATNSSRHFHYLSPRNGLPHHYNEAAKFIKNPPSLSPRLGFANMRALRKHMVKALKQLVCPQSEVHGWTGMVLSPMVYALLEPTAFAIPENRGPVAVYAQFATPSMIKTADNLFKRSKMNTSCMRTSGAHASACLHKHCRPIQGLQRPNPHWMEPKHVNH